MPLPSAPHKTTATPARPKAKRTRFVPSQDFWRASQCSKISRGTQPSLIAEGQARTHRHGVLFTVRPKAAPRALSGIPIGQANRWGLWRLGAAQRRYNERLTTQVSWRTPSTTAKRRISRRLQIGKTGA